MIYDITGIIYVGLIYVSMLAIGVFCIVKSVNMRHDKPGQFSPDSEEAWRYIYKDLLNYSSERVEAEIAELRYEIENQDPKELLKDMREWIAEMMACVLFGLSCFCLFFGCTIPLVSILAIIGILGIFTSVIIGWIIAYIYCFLNQLYRWYVVRGAS